MFCPQCGAELGEGARGCAACGWASSRKTLWIVLGSIAGFGLLVCCGVGTWFGLKTRKAFLKGQHDISALAVFVARVQVLNYAKRHEGALPPDLAKARAEPLETPRNGQTRIETGNGGQGQDLWERPLRYTPGKDGTYEVRSAGPDGQFDNADDLVEKGSVADDLKALTEEIGTRAEKMMQENAVEFMRGIPGVDVQKIEEELEKDRQRRQGGNAPAAPPAPAPPPAPEGGEKPAEPPKPGGEPPPK